MANNLKVQRKSDDEEGGDLTLSKLSHPFNEYAHNTYEELLEERIILLNGDLSESLIEKAVVPIMKMAQEKGPIQVWINSFGGSITDSQAVVDVLTTVDNAVITMVFGKAMSAGFDVFISGDYRIMYPNSLLMCHVPNDLVFCANGLKEIQHLKIGDVVEHGNKTSKVLAVRSRQYNGLLYELKIEKLPPLLLTPDHPVLVRRGISKVRGKTDKRTKHLISEKQEFVPIKDIHKWDYVCFPKYKFEEKQIWKMEITSTHAGLNKIPMQYQITEEFAELLGWYLAEGSTAGEFGIQFSLGGDEKIEATRLCYLLENIFGIPTHYNERKNRNVIEIGVNSKILAYNFKKVFGKNAKEKWIPDFIMKSPKKIIKSFLLAYIKGDGSIKNFNKSGIALGTVSKQLSYQLFQALSKLNILPSWKKQIRKDRLIKGSKYVAKGGILYYVNIYGVDINKLYPKSMKECLNKWRVFEDDNGFWVPVRNIKIVPYNGLVYNIETESHYYTAPVVVHNCHSGSANLGLQTLPALNIEADLHREYFHRWAKFYATRTNISEKEWLTILNTGNNKYFFAEEAIQKGLAHLVVAQGKKSTIDNIKKLRW